MKEAINNHKIPAHWQLKKLGEVGTCVTGTTPPKSDDANYGNEIPFVKPPQINNTAILEFSEYLSEKGASKARILPPNSILVTCIGNLGRIGINQIPVAFNQQINAVIPFENIESKFLFYQAQSLFFIRQLKSFSSATTVAIVNKGNFEKINIVAPPLPEQQAIVAKIEELLSELDNGKQQLLTAQQQLKVYRQSLLKWAFEGKLTNKDVKKGELPKGWKTKQLKEITSVLGDGLHGTPKYSETGEYYFINGNNLNDGKIEIKGNTKRVPFEEYNKYKKPLSESSVLVSINGSLGYTAFYNNEKVVLGKSACYFNVIDSVSKNYVRYFLTTSFFQSYAIKNATGSTIKNVGLKAMRELPIPIPETLEEQQLIVSELESKLTVCDKIEATISQSLQQAETLRQSILKKAFEGKLVNIKQPAYPL